MSLSRVVIMQYGGLRRVKNSNKVGKAAVRTRLLICIFAYRLYLLLKLTTTVSLLTLDVLIGSSTSVRQCVDKVDHGSTVVP